MKRKKNWSAGFTCPKCGHGETHVCDSRGDTDATRRKRRRYCEGCGQKFSTVEITAEEYEVLIGNPQLATLKAELGAAIDRHLLRIVPKPNGTHAKGGTWAEQ